MKPPTCRDHNVAMLPWPLTDNPHTLGASLHGQRWWICTVIYATGLVQRATCGNTAVTT